MKTRIISGIVMGIIVAVFLALGMLVSPLFITAFIAFIASVAIVELLKNVARIESKFAIASAVIYGILNVVAFNSRLDFNASIVFGFQNPFHSHYSGFSKIGLSVIFTVIFFVIAAVICLKNQGKFNLAQIFGLTAFPIIISFAFSCLGMVLNSEDGIYYLLLMLNFSSVCDMGAYFVGVTLGKHKLCPIISPKKTVEGAIGGIVSSIIVTFIISLCFNKSLIIPMLITVPFCVLGMIGDLFASSVKRSVDLKDYGSLIPGHGGILDRFDSIIMIAPVLYLVIELGVI